LFYNLIKKLLSLILIILFILVIPINFVVGAELLTKRFLAVKDTYVRSKYEGDNYGDMESVYCGTRDNKSVYYAYFCFSLLTEPANTVKVTIELHATKEFANETEVLVYSTVDWDEYSVSYLTCPRNIESLGDYEMEKDGNLSIDVTKYLDNASFISIMIKCEETRFKFYSREYYLNNEDSEDVKEYAEAAPKIVWTYSEPVVIDGYSFIFIYAIIGICGVLVWKRRRTIKNK